MFIQANYFYVNSSIEKGEVMANLKCYKNEVTVTSDKKFFHKNVPNVKNSIDVIIFLQLQRDKANLKRTT